MVQEKSTLSDGCTNEENYKNGKLHGTAKTTLTEKRQITLEQPEWRKERNRLSERID